MEYNHQAALEAARKELEEKNLKVSSVKNKESKKLKKIQ